MASLHFIGGRNPARRRVTLEKEHTVVGRDDGCDVVVPWAHTSRQHFRITRRDGRFFLADMETCGGTWLNNRQIKGLSPLLNGDRIQLGGVEAIFELPLTPLDDKQWPDCSDSQRMLSWVRHNVRVTERRLRLFAAGCCGQFGLLRWAADQAAAVERFEQYAEGVLQKDILSRELGNVDLWASDAWEAATVAARKVVETGGPPFVRCSTADRTRWSDDELWAAYFARERMLCNLLRDIFGNPFRPAKLAEGVLSWNDHCVVKLANAIYQDRAIAPDRMSVLSDALEEAGVTDSDILSHCRGPGPHARGCFVVDLILEKS
jgi:hypothetical protein